MQQVPRPIVQRQGEAELDQERAIQPAARQVAFKPLAKIGCMRQAWLYPAAASSDAREDPAKRTPKIEPWEK